MYQKVYSQTRQVNGEVMERLHSVVLARDVFVIRTVDGRWIADKEEDLITIVEAPTE